MQWCEKKRAAEVLSVGWSGAFRCVLTQRQGGKTSAMILEKQLLLPINLGRVIRPFPNYLESIIPLRERLFESRKHWRRLTIFREVDVKESSPQGQTVQCAETAKYPEATSQTLRASVSMLMVKVHDSKIRKRLFSPNTAYQHKHLKPTVKHGGGRLMIRACFEATGPQHTVELPCVPKYFYSKSNGKSSTSQMES